MEPSHGCQWQNHRHLCSSFTSTSWGWHYFYLLIIYLYPPEMSLMSILRLVSSFYLHMYFHVHMYAGICGCIYLLKPEVSLECQPYCFWRQGLSFTWNLPIQPGQWAPWIYLFSSPALRLQILVTMSGLCVGSEDKTQDLKQFTSWASSRGPGAGTF